MWTTRKNEWVWGYLLGTEVGTGMASLLKLRFCSHSLCSALIGLQRELILLLFEIECWGKNSPETERILEWFFSPQIPTYLISLCLVSNIVAGFVCLFIGCVWMLALRGQKVYFSNVWSHIPNDVQWPHWEYITVINWMSFPANTCH